MMWRLVLVIVLLVAAGCTAENQTPFAAIDTETVFADVGDLGSMVRVAGCGSDQAVAIYLDTVIARRAEVVEQLEQAGSADSIELRVGLAETVPWNVAGPKPDDDIEVAGIAVLVSATSTVTVFESTIDNPIDGLALQLEERIDGLQAQRDRQQDRYEAAVDADNNRAATRRLATVTRQSQRVQLAQRDLHDLLANGPRPVALALRGTPGDLSNYLASLRPELAYDAVVVTDDRPALIKKRWDSSFTSVEDLQSIFANTTMLPIPLQFRVTNSGYGCDGGDGSTSSPPSTEVPIVPGIETAKPEHPFAAYPYAPVEETPSADLTGTLVVEGNCAFVIEPNFDERHVLLLPSGETSWDPDTQILTVFGAALEVGTEVSLGGVGVGRADLVQPIAEECLPATAWTVSSVI